MRQLEKIIFKKSTLKLMTGEKCLIEKLFTHGKKIHITVKLIHSSLRLKSNTTSRVLFIVYAVWYHFFVGICGPVIFVSVLIAFCNKILYPFSL